MISGDEQDALTGARRHLKFRAGQRKAVKRRVNRRERQQGRRAARDGGE
jgi:hypothetical protein